MKTETVTYLKEHANSLELEEDLLVTKKGKPAYMVQSYSDYEFQQEIMALLKLVKLSEKTLSSKELSLDEAFE
ncbi:type II toxin-antitoxin system Phd/YefM family antitoxin [Idiomarina sp. M1R2S28]|jgi:PHD/YefM family antitoxin component YafN of YafNO toxin-antitoxin module|uniref:Type II toxin-antitoxin system Phd/YefM family antitoxin n=1 Tax=Idiomarina rhizosphaerae TaxID=2961572 RepID=A0A9X2FV11_9GAMM|nr:MULTISPECIES: type II toxin-antitoxin system Phd/YefM family antitoxin [Idiomarina]MAA62454.1 prevent-host-death protein [Idiomarina sp.]MCP1339581.1 type II toxin-antitoxin system Phd/YefM family antitoxin [Idiomarina rhizosphaerae]TDO53386.1 antitoxin Phd_YefM of type II toxin-antitoxin system [Idiomarina sp. 017G]|tara:strand:- start:17854 stop:18072 length:219 start_codon:yes stop_codon:yes gene_type:complete